MRIRPDGACDEAARELDRDPDVASVSLFMPQPWLDTYDTGAAAVIYAAGPGSPGRYQGHARGILDYIWSIRKELFLAIRESAAFIEGPGASSGRSAS